MRRLIVAFAVVMFLCLAPLARAQDSGSSDAPSGRPWIRLIWIVPASAAIGFGAVYVRRRFRDER